MRRKPYTQRGIKQVKCLRCGKTSSQQWQICALDNKWAGICKKCDIELNKLVLKFIGIKNWQEIIKKYEKFINRELKWKESKHASNV